MSTATAAAPTTASSLDRDAMVYRAKLAEQAERYDEMAEYMRELVKSVNSPLTVEERNLLSVAFKNAVGARRASLRIINSLEAKQKQRNQLEYIETTHQYQEKVAAELSKVCDDIIDLLKNHLLISPSIEDDIEAQVFYWKMQGDYYRYLCEFTTDVKKQTATQLAKEAYEKATAIAGKELNATHPVRLGLALNYSVFHYEILSQPEVACQIAKNAFEDAISQLDTVDEESYRDSTLIMQLLRDNLTLWTTDTEGGQQQAAAQQPSAQAPPAQGEPQPNDVDKS